MKEKFYICSHCGNLVGMIKNAGVPIICCGEKMQALVPNTVDASGEKHLPVVKIDGDTVTVSVGSIEHPMVEEHFIEWIFVQTKNGGQRKTLSAGEKPVATFCLANDEVIAVYAYCNIHGLWSTKL